MHIAHRAAGLLLLMGLVASQADGQTNPAPSVGKKGNVLDDAVVAAKKGNKLVIISFETPPRVT